MRLSWKKIGKFAKRRSKASGGISTAGRSLDADPAIAAKKEKKRGRAQGRIR
jgi:hypothetical protein